MPEIQKALDVRFKDQNVQALGISTGDPASYLRVFKEQENITFPLLLADPNLPNPYYQELFETWELNPLYPTILVLDSQGIIRFRATGLEGIKDNEVDLNSAFDLIETLLGEAQTQES